jgi:hypothetical protein
MLPSVLSSGPVKPTRRPVRHFGSTLLSAPTCTGDDFCHRRVISSAKNTISVSAAPSSIRVPSALIAHRSVIISTGVTSLQCSQRAHLNRGRHVSSYWSVSLAQPSLGPAAAPRIQRPKVQQRTFRQRIKIGLDETISYSLRARDGFVADRESKIVSATACHYNRLIFHQVDRCSFINHDKRSVRRD